MKMLLGSVAALLMIVTAAHGADLPVKAPMMRPVAAMTTWTGFYIGAHIGGAFRDNGSMIGGTGGSNDGRFMGGGQIGADYQFANAWVIGFEANYSALAGNDGSVAFPGGFTFEDRTRGLFSATGRLGYAWGPALLYGKGGYAYRDSRTTMNGPGGVIGVSSTGNSRNGYTVGGGVEYMFMPNWSAKIEYQYYEFDQQQFTAPPVLVAAGGTRDEEHTIKLGLNYRFGGSGNHAR